MVLSSKCIEYLALWNFVVFVEAFTYCSQWCGYMRMKLKFNVWAACRPFVSGWCWLLGGCFRGACISFQEIVHIKITLGVFFRVMKVPNIFLFQLTFSAMRYTKKMSWLSQAVQGCWALICCLRLPPWGLEVPLSLNLFPVSVKILREHGRISDVCCHINSSGCHMIY